MVLQGNRPAADGAKACARGAQAIVAVLEVAKIRFVQRPDPAYHVPPDVGAGKDDAFDLPVPIELVDVLLAGANLHAPIARRHECPRMLQSPIRASQPAA